MKTSCHQRVYHGSPHKFERFESSQIKNGMYGWGLHFAEEKDTAEKYCRDYWSPESIRRKHKEMLMTLVPGLDVGTAFAISNHLGYFDNSTPQQAVEKAMYNRFSNANFIRKNRSSLIHAAREAQALEQAWYVVEAIIPSDEHLISFYATLQNQTPYVMQRIEALIARLLARNVEIDRESEISQGSISYEDLMAIFLRDFQNRYCADADNANRFWSEMLLDEGLAGIRYTKARGSSVAGNLLGHSLTSNFMIWDMASIEIADIENKNVPDLVGSTDLNLLRIAGGK